MPRKPASRSVLLKGVRAHDGAGRRRWLVDKTDREAVQNAVPVHQALDLVSGRREFLGDTLIPDEDALVWSDQLSHRPQGADRIVHVVDTLEGTGEVVAVTQLGIGGVAYLEVDAIGETNPFGILPCLGDRGVVHVETVDDGIRVCPGDGDAGPARP